MKATLNEGPVGLSAEQFDFARRHGEQYWLISQILPADGFAEHALEWGRNMARLSRGAQITKRLMRHGEPDLFTAYLEVEPLRPQGRLGALKVGSEPGVLFIKTPARVQCLGPCGL